MSELSPEEVELSLQLAEQLLPKLHLAGKEPVVSQRLVEQHLAEVRTQLLTEGWASDRVDRFLSKHRGEVARLRDPDYRLKLREANTMPEVGEKVDDQYLLVRTLQVGGFGKVYGAKDLANGKYLALKLVKTNNENATDLSGRLDRLVAMPNHENLVRVWRHGSTLSGTVHYVVMELIPGGTLSDYLKHCSSGGLPLEQVIKWGCQLARGIEHFQNKTRLIHRDLKPDNVLLTGDPPDIILKIADLDGSGLAESLDHKQTHHGTTTYRSPEQAEKLGVTSATDIHSLGVILYEMLSGKPPYDSNRAILHHRAVAPVKVLKAKWKDLDVHERLTLKRISKVCSVCLRKRPDSRYLSVTELRVDLERIGEGKEPIGRALSPIGLMREFVARQPNSHLAVTVIVGFLLIGLAVGAWLWIGADYGTYMVAEGQRDIAAIKEQWKSIEPISFTDQNVNLPESTYVLLNDFVEMCEGLIASRPDDRELATILGRARLKQAAAFTKKLHLGEATTAAKRAQTIFASAPPPEMSDELAWSWRAIAFLSLALNHPDPDAARMAVSYRVQAVKGPPPQPSAAISLFYDRLLLIIILRKLKMDDERVKVRNQAVEELELTAGIPNRAHYHVALLTGFLLCGLDSDELNQADKATEYFKRGFDESKMYFREEFAHWLLNFPSDPIPSWEYPDDLKNLVPTDTPQRKRDVQMRRTVFFRRQLVDRPENMILTHLLNHSLLLDLLSDLSEDRIKTLTEFDQLSQWLAMRETDPNRMADLAELYITLTFLSLRSSPYQPLHPKFGDFLEKAIGILNDPSVRSLTVDRVQLLRATAYLCRAVALGTSRTMNHDVKWARDGINALSEASATKRKPTSHIDYLYPIFEEVLANRVHELLTDQPRQVAEARLLADEVVFAKSRSLPVSGEAMYNSACAYAIASEEAESLAVRTRLAEEAVAALSSAFDRGFDRPIDHRGDLRKKNQFKGRSPLEYMESDPNLDSLRSRPDYRDLVTRIKKEKG